MQVPPDERLSEIEPKVLLDASYLRLYEEQMAALQAEIVLLRSTLYVLGHFLRFRFDLFVKPTEQTLQALAIESLGRSAVLIEWKILLDNNPASIVLPKLARDIVAHVKPEYRADASESTLPMTRSAELGKVLQRVKRLRMKNFAHFDRKSNTLCTGGRNLRISLRELLLVSDFICRSYRVLCFGCGRGTIPWCYVSKSPEKFTDDSTDVTRLLEGIALASHLLKMPEDEPGYWECHWGRLPRQDVALINAYRQKAGLKEKWPSRRKVE